MNEPNAPERQNADDLRELYRAAPQPEPPVALGDDIRQAARDSLRVSAQRGAWPWRQGVAVAAVLVLSVSILLLFPREQLHAPGEAPVQPPAVSDAPQPAQPAAPVPEPLPAPAAESKRNAAGKTRQEAPPAAARTLLQAPADERSMDSSAAGAVVNIPRETATDSRTLVEEAEQPDVADDVRDDADVLEKSYYRSSPELWISHIERLLSEGRFADAKREFDAFKAQHPQHPYAAR
ncbi:MAG: hypothetical protein OET44_05175 [Gammaproteobacteria bacterium]|nr:hypothetical protein [Gammaproteobacteria bacterium]